MQSETTFLNNIYSRLQVKYPESGHHSNSTRIIVLFLALTQSNFSTMVTLSAKESGHCSAVKGLFWLLAIEERSK